MVHHDATLDRVTEAAGLLRDFTAAALKQIAYRRSGDRIMTLGELLDLVAGRVPLFIELKSRYDGDTGLAVRAAGALAGYPGPVAVMSFDPRLLAEMRERAPSLPRGIVGRRRERPTRPVFPLGPGGLSFVPQGAAPLGAAQARRPAYLLDLARACPHFVAYRLQDLPTAIPLLARHLLRLPLLTWTVRSEAERAAASRHAEQIIFEGFRPALKETGEAT
jgi:glycerophosphoryl diester phosphodiesterase